ncbi:MAG: hypothetical protein PVH61_25635 [Candidatus Aminicenantes bacterium]
MRKWKNGVKTNNYKQIPNYNVCSYKVNDQAFIQLIIKSMNQKGSHGLHQDTFKLQTMTALIKSFCGGVQGGQFFQKAPPLAAGGKKNEKAV